MLAEDIAVYFSQKITKLILCDLDLSVNGRDVHRRYSVEPLAVRDNVLHALVMMKKEEGGYVNERNRTCGTVEIPLVDGDTVEMIVDMAIAAGDFQQDDIELAPLKLDDRRITRAFLKLYHRTGELPQPPRM